jgi:hypothetical protein
MTDKEILDDVYKQLSEPVTEMPIEYRGWVWKCKIAAKFIEDERKKREDPSFKPTEGLPNTVSLTIKRDKKNPRINEN